MITNGQIRAARALLNWKQTDLAAAAKLSEMSVKNIERGDTDSRMSTMQAVRSALEAAGIIFIDSNGNGPGVRLRDPA
ncbi:helix-turn-helix transcriptional regulator [Neorhizobium sp. T7_12]|uniref:helix-turn-helix domain-containing protein n=1 Tax=Neorhizobium sp. T7_12 TaxID=2093832 RepID=UPI000CF8D4D7|nr:helix-turn-helix transcriptional regulator [Neorhizobium sp. T7_12]